MFLVRLPNFYPKSRLISEVDFWARVLFCAGFRSVFEDRAEIIGLTLQILHAHLEGTQMYSSHDTPYLHSALVVLFWVSAIPVLLEVE